MLIQAGAELLSQTAKRCQSGALQCFEAMGAVLAASGVAGGLDQSLDQITPAPLLSDTWTRALEVRNRVKNSLGQWLDGKSSPEQVVKEMEPVLGEAQAITAGAESILSAGYGLDRNEMIRRRQEALKAIAQVLEKTPTP